VVHRIKYCARNPTADLFTYYAEHPFNSHLIHKEFVKRVLNYENKRHIYGFCTKLSKYVGKLENKTICPVTGNYAVTDIVPEEEAKMRSNLILKHVRGKIYHVELNPYMSDKNSIDRLRDEWMIEQMFKKEEEFYDWIIERRKKDMLISPTPSTGIPDIPLLPADHFSNGFYDEVESDVIERVLKDLKKQS